MKTKAEETEAEDININFKQAKDESIRHDKAMQFHQRIDAEKTNTVLIRQLGINPNLNDTGKP